MARDHALDVPDVPGVRTVDRKKEAETNSISSHHPSSEETFRAIEPTTRRRKDREDHAEAATAAAAARVGATASSNTNKTSVDAPPFVAAKNGVEDEGAKEGEVAGIDFAGGPTPGTE